MTLNYFFDLAAAQLALLLVWVTPRILNVDLIQSKPFSTSCTAFSVCSVWV